MALPAAATAETDFKPGAPAKLGGKNSPCGNIDKVGPLRIAKAID
ncbi:hypothetical protein U2W12_02390 [Methylomicrobium sp. Wu6]|nr:hypothetical protein [Methylomicrobium sp. Wu6]